MFQTNSRGFDQNVDFINKWNVEHHGWQTVAHKEGKSLTKHYTYPRMRQSLWGNDGQRWRFNQHKCRFNHTFGISSLNIERVSSIDGDVVLQSEIRNNTQYQLSTFWRSLESGLYYDKKATQKSILLGGRGLKFSLYGCCSILYSFTCRSAIHESSTAMVWAFTVKENSWKKVYFSPFPHQSTKNIEKSEPTTIHRHYPQVQRHQSSPLPQHLALPSSSRPQECSPPAVTAMAGPRPAAGRH